jgi:hypothetical protein
MEKMKKVKGLSNEVDHKSQGFRSREQLASSNEHNEGYSNMLSMSLSESLGYC